MIAIFGGGVIGRAFGNAVENLSREVIDEGVPESVSYVDPRLGLKVPDHELRMTDLTFVCVPTPTGPDGRQDLSDVFGVMRRLISIQYEGLVVIRSTVTPANVRLLQRIYPLRIATLPEFLTEARAEEEALEPEFFVVGACEADRMDLVTRFLGRLWPANLGYIYHYTSPAGAMLVKYWVNCCLASRVALANEFKLYWDAVGDGLWDHVSQAFMLDTRCGGTHMVVPGPDGEPGFGGKCFPKDVAAFAHEVANYVERWEGGVLDGALSTNARVRKFQKLEEVR